MAVGQKNRYPKWLALVNGTKDYLRSNFWWLKFEPYPNVGIGHKDF